ncbi:MAG TPA: homocysteine S-methyltransferase family protein [Aeromicrobium sp.]|nr:homocysteine S-methyltransferase family protein [Aeromicrobium sp.]
MTTLHVTDGGLETDLVFNHHVELPEFAAFPLLDSAEGRAMLRRYYGEYTDIARRASAPLLLETPTWRANPDHAALLGYSTKDLDRVNRQSVEFLSCLASGLGADVPAWSVGGIIGPRGDGYRTDGPINPAQAAEYHRPQLEAFRSAGAHRATALTLTEVGEAVGIVNAATDVRIPVAIGFTVETDGRLPDGTTLNEAITAVDSATQSAAAYFLINCAHPKHINAGLQEGAWTERIGGLRVNASTMSHAELDEATELDDGDPTQLAIDQKPLLDSFKNLQVLGGCCGTDHRHIAAMWDVAQN